MKFHPAAEADLDHQMEKIEAARVGYGRRLYEAVMEKAAQAEAFPASGPKVQRIAKRFNARQFLVDDFGLWLIVIELGGEQQVLAVSPGRRRPRHWRARLSSLAP